MGLHKHIKSSLRAAFLLMLLALPAGAQDVPKTQDEITLSFAPVVKKAAPAVVNIYTKTRVRTQVISPFMNDPIFQQFFGKSFVLPGRTREQMVSSLGSGVIINADGMVVTSHHVIKDADAITVVLADKREFEAKVVTRDAQSDLAFLRIEAKGLPYLEMRDSDTLEVGDLVLAIGNPFGVGQTVTSGIISALARRAQGVSDYQFFIQTDAAINPGNSGGALVDMNGKLIGINTAIYSASGGSLGIGFAIPANMVKALMGGKVQGDKVIRPWLGLAVQPVTPEIAESMGLAVPQGVVVKAIYPGSPAEKSGIKTGDILLSVAGVPVSSEQELRYRLMLGQVGDVRPLEIIGKDGQRQTVNVELIAPPEKPARDQRTLKGRQPLAGITVANLSPALLSELDMDNGTQSGVVVVAVADGVLGGDLSLQPGDIVLQVNDTKVTSAAQLETLMRSSANNWKIMYRRGDNVQSLVVRM